MCAWNVGLIFLGQCTVYPHNSFSISFTLQTAHLKEQHSLQNISLLQESLTKSHTLPLIDQEVYSLSSNTNLSND